MENKMIEVKESFWNKFKKFFRKVFLGNKNDLTNDEIEAVDKINEAYKHSEMVEEEKIENIEKIIDRTENNLDKEEKQPGRVNSKSAEYDRTECNVNYKKANVNGKQIRCYETNSGDTYSKRYVSIGEKECSYTNTNGIETERFVVYGHRESPMTIKGMNFTEKVRDKRLDKELSKTTKEGIVQEVRKGPLIDNEDIEDKYKGCYEIKDTTYANGNRLVEDTKQVIDENGSMQTIYETHSHTSKGDIHTKYFNGQVVFQLVRDDKGTLIKEFDNKGNVINSYQYDKDGKPTETILVVGEDGKIRRKAKTYRGINEIPDMELKKKNGVFVQSAEADEYFNTIAKARITAKHK